METFKKRLTWLVLFLFTGGTKSPLRIMDEGKPYRIIRHGRKVTLEKIAAAPPVARGRRFSKGVRVVVSTHAGFNTGAHGFVIFQEPNTIGRVWVLRDGAQTEVFYYPHELELEADAWC